jgi:signal transduction histidine kinase
MSGWLSVWWPVLTGGVLVLAAAGVLVYSSRRIAVWRSRARAADDALSEANAIRNDFVTLVSHELRTPLTSIAGFADVLRESWQHLDPGEIDEFLGNITAQSGQLAELVEDVLTIPRLQAGRLPLSPEVIDLSELVHDVSAIVFPTTGTREVSVSIPGGIRVWGDAKRVRQVVRNLLENAAKYGGTQVLVEGFPAGEHFVVVVSDNGSGVPDGAEDAIFEHFEQVSKGDARESRGIGLGLPIARRLARAMGGDVWFERRFPTGSRFCFSITTSPESHVRVMAERETTEPLERQPLRLGA